jgi:hypothetical protein
MTVEATLTKLHYLLSQQLDVDAIRAAMQRAVAFGNRQRAAGAEVVLQINQ